MPRFALLRHETPEDAPIPSHWDFLVEREGVLATWRLGQLPQAWQAALGGSAAVAKLPNDACPADPTEAVRLPEHRIAYLDYEGPLTEGRGSVHRCDQGECRWILHADARCRVVLQGKKLRGPIELQQAPDKHGSAAWQLCVRGNEADATGPEADAD